MTGDGGDEVFTEREDVLVDLLARRSRTLPAAVGHFALRNGERGIRTLRRARGRLLALRNGVVSDDHAGADHALLGADLADQVRDARVAAAARERELWSVGWTYSGIGCHRRAAAVPEWEPVSADSPAFHVASPLADATLVGDALALRRDVMVAGALRGQPKWVLRQAALDWLAPDVALYPKIGSADGEILAQLRAHELHDVLDLFSSGTARGVGLSVPAAIEEPTAPLWYGDGWVRAAALVAWFDQATLPPRRRPAITVAASAPQSIAGAAPETRPRQPARPARWRVAMVSRAQPRRADHTAAADQAGACRSRRGVRLAVC